MATTLRIDDALKSDCEAVLEDLGLSMTGAITLFLKQVAKQRAIPFVITCDRVTPANSLVYRPSSLHNRGRIASRFAAEMRESNDRAFIGAYFIKFWGILSRGVIC
ncbi:MAG: type II toxin-antitoxin system RelB/DinJ family antitoxin [Kiritimatiellae bacterium]|nr:type II toxin-antitoxin system RelB/DinJ family antitoxin [Kiritimatiellia bacterium]